MIILGKRIKIIQDNQNPKRNLNGVVYTPMGLAQYLAKKTLRYYFEDQKKFSYKIPQSFKILDPACGDGVLLFSMWQAFQNLLLGSQIKLPDAKEILCGIDIDPDALKKIKNKISHLSKDKNKVSNFNIINTNSLVPFDKETIQEGWDIIRNKYKADDGFDIVVANPPWGADISNYKNRLSKREFILSKGQFDSADLFVELAMTITKPGGYFAFILPDSLFGQERAHLRELLLSRTEIKFIGRFGEKIFEKINRACAILICKNEKMKFSNRIDCLRLTPDLRRSIIEGNIDFEVAESKIAHSVPQDRFLSNKNLLFDIDVKENEQVTLFRINTTKNKFENYLISTRGIELSKKGEVIKCNNCNLWLPKPNLVNPVCGHCKKNIILGSVINDKIVKNEAQSNYHPLIVGENLKRYKINGSFWIDSTRRGISYKEISIYQGPKILVRKTGVGITASIDYTNSFTNQVVYIFKKKENSSIDFPLEFFLAIMNSRAIYYYLAKSHGETEWRSHPYLSQRQVLDLPLPKIDFNQMRNLSKALQITDLIKPYLICNKQIPDNVDAKVEKIIAGLFGLNKKNYELIYQTLDSSEELLPVKMLKNISLANIFSS